MLQFLIHLVRHGCFLFSAPASTLYAPRRRSPWSSTTRFSNSGSSSSRTDLASSSSVPPIEHVTLLPSGCEEGSLHDELFVTLRELPGVPPSLVAIVPAILGSLPQQSPSDGEPDPRRAASLCAALENTNVLSRRNHRKSPFLRFRPSKVCLWSASEAWRSQSHHWRPNLQRQYQSHLCRRASSHLPAPRICFCLLMRQDSTELII